MAWNTGIMTAAAGQLKDILDTLLVANANWSIEDAGAGANIGVYRNLESGGTSDFVLYVGDNQADYSIIELWEDWDSVGHAGVGQSLTLASGGARTLRILKSAGGYGLRVRDTNLIFINFINSFANYIGQLKRFDVSKNMPIYIGTTSTSTSTAGNPLGFRNYDAGGVNDAAWRCLFDSLGNVRTLYPSPMPASATESSATANLGLVIRTSAGEIRLRETPVYAHAVYLLLGVLDGVCYTGATAAASSMTNGETVDLNGVDWMMIEETSGTPDRCGSVVELS